MSELEDAVSVYIVALGRGSVVSNTHSMLRELYEEFGRDAVNPELSRQFKEDMEARYERKQHKCNEH